MESTIEAHAALERHYTVKEIAERWSFDDGTRPPSSSAKSREYSLSLQSSSPAAVQH